MPEEDLRELLGALSEEERAAEYRLEVLRGRMDLVRAELAGRDTAALPPEELARVLMGEEIGGPEDLGRPPGNPEGRL